MPYECSRTDSERPQDVDDLIFREETGPWVSQR